MNQNAEKATQEKPEKPEADVKSAVSTEEQTTTPSTDGESTLKFEIQPFRFGGDEEIQYDTSILTLRTAHMEDEARIYYKDNRWRFVLFDNSSDNDGKKISDIRESAKPFWEDHKKRDKGIKQDLIEYGFCDEDDVENVLSQIKEKAKESQTHLTNQKNFSENKKSTKSIPLTASDIIYLVEYDVLKNDLKNRMFSVDGRSLLLLPHCEAVYEKDEAGIPNYVEMNVNNTTNKLYPLKMKESEPLRAELQRLCWAKHGITCQDARLKEAILLMQGTANKNEKIGINRIHYLDKAIYYDMMLKENNKIIKLTKDGWEAIDDKTMMNPDDDRFVFIRYPHQLPQVMPSNTPDISPLYKYYDLGNEESTLFLMKDTQVSFFEHIQRAMKQLEGVPGSGKTVRTRTMISLVDPSKHAEGYPLSKKTKLSELIRLLYQGYFVAFDNVSEITKDQNDILAQAVSGLSRNDRALYTNDDGFSYPTFKRAIILSGVSITGTESDVLERCYCDEVRNGTTKIDEEALKKQFEKDKPHILAAIFDNICKALGYIDEMKKMEISKNIRLQDYAQYGCAISKAMGYTPESFLEYYMSTFENRDLIALESNALGTAILEFMYQTGYFNGSLDDLMTHLEATIQDHGLHITSEYPKTPKEMGTELKKIQKNLEAVGVTVFKSPKKVNNKRYYVMAYKDFVTDSSRKKSFEQNTTVLTPPTADTIKTEETKGDYKIKIST